jgi:hypothetical protein
VAEAKGKMDDFDVFEQLAWKCKFEASHACDIHLTWEPVMPPEKNARLETGGE